MPTTAHPPAHPSTAAVDEDADERERQEQRERYRELLEELRTIIPGVQVLFAFLLTVPFSQRFTELDDLGRRVFGAALLGVALATVALIAPSAFHRMAARNDRAGRLRFGIRATVAGMVLLTVSVPSVVFVVVRFVFASTAWGAMFAAATFVAAALLWYLVPLLRRP